MPERKGGDNPHKFEPPHHMRSASPPDSTFPIEPGMRQGGSTANPLVTPAQQLRAERINAFYALMRDKSELGPTLNAEERTRLERIIEEGHRIAKEQGSVYLVPEGEIVGPQDPRYAIELARLARITAAPERARREAARRALQRQEALRANQASRRDYEEERRRNSWRGFLEDLGNMGIKVFNTVTTVFLLAGPGIRTAGRALSGRQPFLNFITNPDADRIAREVAANRRAENQRIHGTNRGVLLALWHAGKNALGEIIHRGQRTIAPEIQADIAEAEAAGTDHLGDPPGGFSSGSDLSGPGGWFGPYNPTPPSDEIPPPGPTNV